MSPGRTIPGSLQARKSLLRASIREKVGAEIRKAVQLERSKATNSSATNLKLIFTKTDESSSGFCTSNAGGRRWGVRTLPRKGRGIKIFQVRSHGLLSHQNTQVHSYSLCPLWKSGHGELSTKRGALLMTVDTPVCVNKCIVLEKYMKNEEANMAEKYYNHKKEW